MPDHIYFRIMEYVTDFTSVLPPVLLAAVVYALARRLWLRRRGEPRKSWANEGVRLLLVCWLAGLLALVWTPANFWHKLQYLIRYGWPMELESVWFQGSFSFQCTFPEQLRAALSGGSWQVLGNVLLYVPLGLLLPLVWRQGSWWRVTGTGLALSLVTEVVQPAVGRSFDVDDLIANTLGVLIGWGLFALVRLAAPGAVARCRSGARESGPVRDGADPPHPRREHRET